MDLVEIRKKAKKSKELKTARAVSNDAPQAPPLTDDAVNNKPVEAPRVSAPILEPEAEPEKIIKESALTAPETALPEIDMNPEIAPLAAQSQEDIFLSNIMDVLSHDAFEEAVDEDDLDKMELLCFKLSDEEYAIEINDVSEIVKMVVITDVPKTPDFMLGIISLRGVIIPLLDFRMRLGLDACAYNSKTRIIIATSDGRKMGMVVDAVTEVVSMKKGSLEPPPTLLQDINVDLLKGVGRYDERLLIVPNIARVFDITI